MKILHLDIETAPHKVYTWGMFDQNIGLNQVVERGYTLCWAAKWEGHREIEFSSIHGDGETKMLKRMWKLLDEADAVVHYNGKRFDIPTLNGEFAQHGMMPPSGYHQIDLLRVVRSNFKLLSNKLDYVAKYFGLGSKVKHKGMPLWTGCMEGDETSWKQMETYNKQDVRLLPKLYKKLLPWIKSHPNHALYTADDRPVCPSCGSTHVKKNGTETEKTQTMSYQRYRCTKCKTPIRGRSSVLTKEKRAAILVRSKL